MLMAFRNGCLKVKAGGWRTYYFLRIIVIVLMSSLVTTPLVYAAPDLLERVQDDDLEQVIRLRVGRSKVLRTPFPIQRVLGG